MPAFTASLGKPSSTAKYSTFTEENRNESSATSEGRTKDFREFYRKGDGFTDWAILPIAEGRSA
jgi:hypothetical protein